MMKPIDYAGKCLEYASKLSKEKNLELIVGFYFCPLANKEYEHWWCEDEEGNIIDPTSKQFLSGGIKNFYRKFDGTFECSHCGKMQEAETMKHESSYHYCNTSCLLRDVGL